ncbi:MAG TPA: hypothetical protein VH813_07990 [Candidatus Limnocylindrales bacterium]
MTDRDEHGTGQGPRSATDEGNDPGAFVGREREGAGETIPGGLGMGDRRVAAHSTQPGPVRGPDPAEAQGEQPAGHREADQPADDDVREAGQDR